jgi:PPOX class probable F420-dependent enzyme
MAKRKTTGLDTATPRGKHIQSRLKKELIIWLATVAGDGNPHVVPVWFLWDGSSFLLYSVPGQKVRDIEANPKVELHLNTDPEAEDVVRIAGTASLPKRQPPAYRVPDYVTKYARLIKGYGWTPEGFSADYRVAIRIRPTRFRA